MTYALFRSRVPFAPGLDALLMLLGVSALPLQAQGQTWPVHSMERPRPPLVRAGTLPGPLPPPADAIVLFDGRTLDAWEFGPGSSGWRVTEGVIEVVPGGGSMQTRRQFGDIQLHLEWTTPRPARRSGQDRGNSGVFLMGRYEVQILDSWQNDTYPDGQAGALYGQVPPLANASLPPGEWQSYDIIFHRPRFAGDGRLEHPATITVLHNGVLIHDHVAFKGQTVHGSEARYSAHPDLGPIMLQDHGDPIRFRNIWVRELTPRSD